MAVCFHVVAKLPERRAKAEALPVPPSANSPFTSGKAAMIAPGPNGE
jgi:hypothetical protein